MITIRGIVMSADLVENPPGSDSIEMHLRLQGVGPTAPRRIVIPFSMLINDESLEPESVAAHAFEADIEEVEPKRWVASRITFTAKGILRSSE